MATTKHRPASVLPPDLPRQAPLKKPSPKKGKGPAQDKLAEMGIDKVCERIVRGDSYRAIAADAGVSLAVLWGWLDADPERSARAKEARVTAAKSYDEEALQTVRDAADPFELAKAKEIAHHLRWRAKAVNPREYGDKQQVDLNAKVDMGDEMIKRINGQ